MYCDIVSVDSPAQSMNLGSVEIIVMLLMEEDP